MNRRSRLFEGGKEADMDDNIGILIADINTAIKRYKKHVKEVEIIARHSTEFRRSEPAHLPDGRYICIVEKCDIEDGEVIFECRPVEADRDVDPGELQSRGGLEGKTVRCVFHLHDFWAEQLVKFLDDCGIEDGIIGKRIERAVGCRVGIETRRRPYMFGSKEVTGAQDSYPAPKPKPVRLVNTK
jgi:hypothetical protein